MNKRLATCVLLLVSSVAAAGEKLTTNTMKLGKDERPPAASIQDMAWFAGHWTGEGLGGQTEEIWTAPRDGKMLGMYRMHKDGKPVFYELVVLEEEAGSLIIRVKHFNPDMRGWEERDVSQSFTLVAREGRRVYFDGMTFERSEGDNTLVIYLAIENREKGTVREEKFTYRRVKR